MIKRTVWAVAIAAALSGCSSSDNEVNNPSSEVSADGTLERATSETFLSYLRTALNVDVSGGEQASFDDGGMDMASADSAESAEPPMASPTDVNAAGAAAEESSSERQSSSTNLQEAGVDEADLLKFDAARGLLYAIDFGEGEQYYYPEAFDVAIEESQAPPEVIVEVGEEDSAEESGDVSTEPGDAEPAADIAYYPYKEPVPESIRILEVSEDGGSLSELTRITRDAAASGLRGLYLPSGQERLVAVGAGYGNVWGDWFSPYAFRQQTTEVDVIDVSNPAIPGEELSYQFDGSLVATRMVGSHLYLVLRQYPHIELWHDYPETTAQKEQNDARVGSLSEDDLLPKYSVNDGDRQLLVDAGNCYLNRGVAEPTADLVTLVSVDMSKSTPSIESTCFVGPTEALYASQNALYLSSTRYNYDWWSVRPSYQAETTTDVHKFAFDGPSFSYRGSAEVIGHLGWNQSQKSFRFSESASGELRVLTYREDFFGGIAVEPVGVPETAVVDFATEGEASVDADSVSVSSNGLSATGNARARAIEADVESPVYLTILAESADGNTLETLSRLPNAARPAPIGKPGENLYASRYVGDRAYLITFRVTDPLYVLDLTNPRDPEILGELEIPGFSDYLHPVSESLMLGVGKDAVADDADGDGDGRGAWYQGVKLSLLDVSDPTDPQEVDKVIIGKRGTESAVLSDHHAFTSLKVGNEYRVALPVSLHNQASYYDYEAGQPWEYFGYTHSGLYRYNIDLDAKVIEPLSPMVVEEAPSSGGYYWGGGYQDYNDRSLMVDDYVHYLHSGEFWSSPWEDDAEMTGPQ